MCSSVLRDPILAVKLARYFATLKNFLNFFLLSLNHLNRTVSDLLYKIFRKIKDRGRRQITDDISSALSDSHGHPVISSILRFGSMPDYFRWSFPTVRIHSSVI